MRLADRVAHAEREIEQGPAQLRHGDFWDNNVFFAADRIVLVTDLDFMGVRPRVDDLALTLYYTTSTFTDGQISPQPMHQLAGQANAYATGLDTPLTDGERRSIPLAIARAALGFTAMPNPPTSSTPWPGK